MTPLKTDKSDSNLRAAARLPAGGTGCLSQNGRAFLNRNPHKTYVRIALATMFFSCVACLALSAAAKEYAGPRDIFSDLGVGDAYFDQLSDGGPITSQDRETLLRILHRLRVFPTVALKKWALDSNHLVTALMNAQDYRGQIFRLRGRIMEVLPIKTSPDTAERYEMKTLYRCLLKLENVQQPVAVFVEDVPDQWKKGAKPDVLGGALAIYLKNANLELDGESRAPSLTPIFVAPRLAWYPSNLLGQLGMDAGLLDTVEDQEPLSADEHAAFYDMLAAVERAKPGQLMLQARTKLPNTPKKLRWTDDFGQEQYSIVPLFNDAAKQRGKLVALRGMARLIEKVHVEPHVAKEFGIDHYYNVMLFTPDSQGNPLTFCLLELPEGMPCDGSKHYTEDVEIAGFFFKTWSYPVQIRSDETGKLKTRQQLSPLLIGRSLVWHPGAKPAPQTQLNLVVVLLFVGAMVAVWLIAWRTSRREKRWVDKATEEPPKFDFIDDEGNR